jgi:hypothetical protein
MSRTQPLPIVKVGLKEIEQLLVRLEAVASEDDFKLVKVLLEGYLWLTKAVRERGTSIARLRRLFGLSGSEKLAGIVGEAEPQTPPAPVTPQGETGPDATSMANGDAQPAAGTDDDKNAGGAQSLGEASKPSVEVGEDEKKKVKGHGRVPASAYLDASHIPVPHADLPAGCHCPESGCSGKIYRLQKPASCVRIFGQAPLLAVIWDCEQMRCGTCGKVFTARAPEEARGPKYDESASSMMGVLRYGMGMPLNRLDQLQRQVDTPVPASTQWDVVREAVKSLRPVHEELSRIAAQGSVLHNDDSYMRLLSFMGKRRAALLAAGQLPDPDRTGLFTTAIVAITPDGHTIALFSTGRKHAGENLADLLEKRDAGLPPPIQMSDALSRNLPEGHPTLDSNCLTHGRRKLVDERDNYPAECRDLLEKLGRVYAVDKQCRKEGVSAQERLSRHQLESGPVMDEIRRTMTEALDEKRVEPNSGLGEAFNYLLKRWEKFTLFLRVPGAPLDNNICERALKMAIQHRNNSLFYRSPRGASVGDIYMSLIHTTQLAGENSVTYLTALQRNTSAVAENPAAWLPWNYRDTLAQRGEIVAACPVSRPFKPPRAPPAADIMQPKAA